MPPSYIWILTVKTGFRMPSIFDIQWMTKNPGSLTSLETREDSEAGQGQINREDRVRGQDLGRGRLKDRWRNIPNT